ncbi:MAG: hypothetical protein BroJett011_54850 [Chloroflexota bacterium]|nr:MAG: hypothetical protein BroJett011_54850 [Chloroflexota bacterium]
MDWFLRVAVIWLAIDILVIASVWYAVTTIKPICPNWWRRVVADSADYDSMNVMIPLNLTNQR